MAGKNLLGKELCTPAYDCTLTANKHHNPPPPPPKKKKRKKQEEVVERPKIQRELNHVQLGGPLGTDSNGRRGRSEVVAKVSCCRRYHTYLY